MVTHSKPLGMRGEVAEKQKMPLEPFYLVEGENGKKKVRGGGEVY